MELSAKLTLTSPLLTQPTALRDGLAPVLRETTEKVIRLMQEAMREPKHGRNYRRGPLAQRSRSVTRGLGVRAPKTKGGFQRAPTGSGFHRASAAGEAPASDTGQASSSLVATIDGLQARIEGSEVLRRLDEGTRRIAPRPLVAPALERARPDFERKSDEAIKRLL